MTSGEQLVKACVLGVLEEKKERSRNDAVLVLREGTRSFDEGREGGYAMWGA